VVVLVVVFGRIKVCQWYNLGDDGFIESSGGFQFFFGFFCQAFLRIVFIKYTRSILGSLIHKLPPGIGGIDMPPEDFQKRFIRNFFRIVSYPDCLRMAGSPRRHFFIGWIFLATAGIPGQDFDHAVHVFKIRFHAPETTPGENRAFKICFLHFIHGLPCFIKSNATDSQGSGN